MMRENMETVRKTRQMAATATVTATAMKAAALMGIE